ncbi:hypothetical protein WICMUC_003165 [Wickerhamomyces mucosus]|uniref:Uncharacterized protein n=1 Tax=Wickerhamomyces mucosus TaxID=1378264 RepID=A0A9P8PNH1_9ASCO|nr:hypothetical protein WICMUC_003165 [Wickerhamomyces mucosus]
MGIFRKNSTSSQNSGGDDRKVRLTKEDAQNYKIRTGSVHDPILQAVNEAQPFEEAETSFENQQVSENGIPQANNGNSRLSYQVLATNGKLQDVFGNPITKPDISNPTRSRDERPLDTIRSFEYAITGDLSFRDRLETDQFGFRPRPDFPKFGNGNPYSQQQQQQQQPGNYNQAPTHSFSGDQDAFEQGVYQAPQKADTDQKKKKRGLFGKKK